MKAFSPAAIDAAPRKPRARKVARVLLADTELASRLTLETILSTAGYAVDAAATAGEAIARLDAHEYQLVLADLHAESADAGPHLLAYARQKEFRPATALISSKMSEMDSETSDVYSPDSVVRMSDENVSYLLARMADLIGHRAGRRIHRSLPRR